MQRYTDKIWIAAGDPITFPLDSPLRSMVDGDDEWINWYSDPPIPQVFFVGVTGNIELRPLHPDDISEVWRIDFITPPSTHTVTVDFADSVPFKIWR